MFAKTIILFLQILASLALVWALDAHNYEYYVLLRIFVCSIASFTAYELFRLKLTGWAWTLGSLAVVFNPVAKIELHRETWHSINLAAALVIGYSAYLLKKSKNKQKANGS